MERASWVAKNLYASLGVPTTASAAEIKAAYRQLARKGHPDVGGTTSGFQKIQEAYDVLGDRQRKEEYDKERADWARDLGAIICPSCGAANAVRRKPRPSEEVCCAACSALLPVDMSSFAALQKAHIVAEASRLLDIVGADLRDAAADVLRSGISRIRSRLTKKGKKTNGIKE